MAAFGAKENGAGGQQFHDFHLRRGVSVKNSFRFQTASKKPIKISKAAMDKTNKLMPESEVNPGLVSTNAKNSPLKSKLSFNLSLMLLLTKSLTAVVTWLRSQREIASNIFRVYV